jgi:hypothetical protein
MTRTIRMGTMKTKRTKEWVEGYAAVNIDLSRNPYLVNLKIEDPDDLVITTANQKYTDWREGWLARFHGEKA